MLGRWSTDAYIKTRLSRCLPAENLPQVTLHCFPSCSGKGCGDVGYKKEAISPLLHSHHHTTINQINPTYFNPQPWLLFNMRLIAIFTTLLAVAFASPNLESRQQGESCKVCIIVDRQSSAQDIWHIDRSSTEPHASPSKYFWTTGNRLKRS